ncbi:hypothetical protein OIU85_014118 [Salix viminalis]|uniref:Uncharacterized protein n=1 Tax=Salix viminalis TaxID=40686 RepID=A0A9Q0SDH8_SALVM|nr:hypothetical protein OIU85_014118 [Salix viminalis]
MKDEPITDVRKAEELVLNQNEEMLDVPVLSIDQKKAEEVADIHEISEELVSTPGQKEHAHACTSSQELPDQAPSQLDSVEKSVEIYSGNKIDEVPSEPDNSGVVGNLPSPERAPEAAAISPAKGLDGNSLQCAGEGKGSGGTMCGPLFFSDDSPKASGALMPGSNESESGFASLSYHLPHAFSSRTSGLPWLCFDDHMFGIPYYGPASSDLSFMDTDFHKVNSKTNDLSSSQGHSLEPGSVNEPKPCEC